MRERSGISEPTSDEFVRAYIKFGSCRAATLKHDRCGAPLVGDHRPFRNVPTSVTLAQLTVHGVGLSRHK